jgi:hypothetical protein
VFVEEKRPFAEFIFTDGRFSLFLSINLGWRSAYPATCGLKKETEPILPMYQHYKI